MTTTYEYIRLKQCELGELTTCKNTSSRTSCARAVVVVNGNRATLYSPRFVVLKTRRVLSFIIIRTFIGIITRHLLDDSSFPTRIHFPVKTAAVEIEKNPGRFYFSFPTKPLSRLRIECSGTQFFYRRKEFLDRTT